MNQEKLQGVVRHALTFIGGILVMKGLLDEEMLNELAGALAAVAGTVWSVINKIKSNKLEN